MSDTAARYVLKHTEHELQRLEGQGAFLRPLTRHFLVRAGLAPGMRVLDVGSGAGDVAFLAAELVGPTGEVVGIERNPEALSVATDRAALKGLDNVRFVASDTDGVAALAGRRGFDAIVGRLVTVHQPDPVRFLTDLARHLSPGGVIAFEEIDLDARSWSTHPIPALDELWGWVWTVAGHGRFSGGLGPAFLEAFAEAGLGDRRVFRTGAMENAASRGVYPWIAGFVRSLVPAMRALGEDVSGIDVDTYEQRLRAQVEASGACFVPVHFVGGIARRPA